MSRADFPPKIMTLAVRNADEFTQRSNILRWWTKMLKGEGWKFYFINEWIGLKNVTIFCAYLKIRTGNALNITKERNSFSDFSWQRASLASTSYLYLLFPVSTICSSNFLPVCILVYIVKQAEICLYLKCCGFSSTNVPQTFQRCEIDRALV